MGEKWEEEQGKNRVKCLCIANKTPIDKRRLRQEWKRLVSRAAPGLYSLLQAVLLCVNAIAAIAVLHEERFLKNIGWGKDHGTGGFGEEGGIKSQLMNLIRSVRTIMRVPLIIVNSIVIVLLLLFG
ncbi:PREDICTED: immediate early response 3-interacting protein 1-like [Elephantulus edwardii]|uniref:immediate early response 3-interacting protein 1-like n=1 Tax=Elephantulus edwardii TaxID=28737 RepID=UPI0003F0C5D3|nr:PREDICTED: immediate early response 3-interacting protein 1-like [Elephantulus edwardii]